MLKVLLNTTRVGTVTHYAGGTYDTINSAWEIPGIESAGGKLVTATTEILTAATLAHKLHDQGAETHLLDTIMIVQAQRAGTIDYNDMLAPPAIGATTVQQAIDIIKAYTVTTTGILLPFVFDDGVTEGDFCYISANETLSKTDASNISKSKFVAAHVGLVTEGMIQGLVQTAKFASTSATPAVGEPVFLACADDEPGNTAAGKLNAICPSTTDRGKVVAEIGIVSGVDPVTFGLTKVARVVIQPKQVCLR